MIRVFKKSKLQNTKDIQKSLAVAYRAGKECFTKCLDSDAKVEFNPETSELSFKFHMKDGDVIFIGEGDGMIEKKKVEHKK